MQKFIFHLTIALLFCWSTAAIADDRLLFNRGAELAASEAFEEAVEVLRQVAVARDRTIAARALTLLGQIEISSAIKSLSENPVETPGEQRKTIVDHLKSAELFFSESLSLQTNEEVRQSLETLRAWRHNMTNAWDEYDREQQRNAELQQRIQHLASWEEKLTEKAQGIAKEANSPRKFQQEYESGREQKQLAGELSLLQEVPMSDEELKEKWELLPEMTKMAEEAAEHLSKHRTVEALPKQQQVLDYLRSLLKQEQNQSPQNQEQQEQQPQSKDEPEDDGEQKEKQESETDQQDGTTPEEESPEEKAERLLIQVRRKEQAAKEQRELLRTLLMQAVPVEKDW